MNNWKKISIGEFADFNPPEKLRKDLIAKKVPMDKLTPFERKIKGFEMAKYTNGPKFRNGDTLVAKITPCLENGKTAQVDILDDNEVAFGSSEFIVLRENKNSINDYIFYMAKSPVFRNRAIGCMEGTSGRKRVNEGALKRQLILVPNISIQKKIASVLSSLDDKIEINNKINASLQAIGQTLYKYWFMQFDFPDENGNPYKSSGGKMVYSLLLKREIPAGWEVKSLAEWIEKDKSGDWGKESNQGSYQLEVDCIRGADINGLNGNGDVKAPRRFILTKNSHKVLESHDLIVEISGGSPTQSTGRLSFVTEETLKRFNVPLICSNFCKAVSLKDKKLLFNFAQAWNSAYDNGILFGFEGKTSGIKNLLFDTFVSSFQTAFPEKVIVDKFYELMLSLHNQSQKLIKQNLELTQLRDWLLPMLMNGQVKLTDLEDKIRKN